MTSVESLAGRTIFVSGGSRGIGMEIAMRCAADGANVALAAKTDKPHPRLPGTIHSAAEAVERAGGRALPLICDIRDADAVASAVRRCADAFGGIDAVVNNASAIQLTGTEETEIKRFDLMISVNMRGSFAVTRAAVPHLLRSTAPRILTIAPPLDFSAQWWNSHPPYTLAKYGMSLLAWGWASEFNGRIASNCLWPRTVIDTAAVRNLLGGEAMARRSRKPAIMADAAHWILTRPLSFTGWFCLDDLVLAAGGASDFGKYAVDSAAELASDFFLPTGTPEPGAANGALGWRAPDIPGISAP